MKKCELRKLYNMKNYENKKLSVVHLSFTFNKVGF